MGAAISKALVFQPPAHAAKRTPESSSSSSSSSSNNAQHQQTRPQQNFPNAGNFFWLRTRRGSLIEAAFVARRSEVVVLFSHANAEDAHGIFPWLAELAERCDASAMCYSYTGYARSVGTPSEADVYADADAAWDWLVLKKDYAPEQILLYGRSIGSGPATYLAERLSKRRTPPAGLVLQSPVLSVFRIALNFRVTVPGDMFPNVDRIKNVACPVLVVHGKKDEIVPLWHGEGLWLATPLVWRYEPFWVADAGHNNVELLLRDSGLLFETLSAFFAHCASPDTRRKQQAFLERIDFRDRRRPRTPEPAAAIYSVFSCGRCGGQKKLKNDNHDDAGRGGGAKVDDDDDDERRGARKEEEDPRNQVVLDDDDHRLRRKTTPIVAAEAAAKHTRDILSNSTSSSHSSSSSSTKRSSS